jgi:hypothetical protein
LAVCGDSTCLRSGEDGEPMPQDISSKLNINNYIRMVGPVTSVGGKIYLHNVLRSLVEPVTCRGSCKVSQGMSRLYVESQPRNRLTMRPLFFLLAQMEYASHMHHPLPRQTIGELSSLTIRWAGHETFASTQFG